MNDAKQATEELIGKALWGLIKIANQHGVDIKRISEILNTMPFQIMKENGMTQQKIMAISGYSLKTVRRALSHTSTTQPRNLLEVIVNAWFDDPDFPDTLPIRGKVFPTFEHLCARHGRDFTPPSLLDVLRERNLIDVEGNQITLKSRHVISRSGPDMILSSALSIQALLETLEYNLSSADSPHIERRWWSYRIHPNDLAKLRTKIKHITEEYRDQVLQELEAIEAPIAESEDKSLIEAGIGVYWFEREPR